MGQSDVILSGEAFGLLVVGNMPGTVLVQALAAVPRTGLRVGVYNAPQVLVERLRPHAIELRVGPNLQPNIPPRLFLYTTRGTFRYDKSWTRCPFAPAFNSAYGRLAPSFLVEQPTDFVQTMSLRQLQRAQLALETQGAPGSSLRLYRWLKLLFKLAFVGCTLAFFLLLLSGRANIGLAAAPYCFPLAFFLLLSLSAHHARRQVLAHVSGQRNPIPAQSVR